MSVALAALLLFTSQALAQEVLESESAPRGSVHPALSLRLEPGLTVAVTEPQSRLTDAGFAQTVKVFLGVTRYLEVGPTATFTTLPASSAMAAAGADAGTAWNLGAGLRLMRPHDAAPGHRGFAAASPWLDADALYVRTGELDRPGFAAAAGLAIPLDAQRRFWIGPFVRYFQIVQGERSGFDNRDAQLLTFGVSLEVGSGLEPARRRVVAEPAATPMSPAPVVPVAPADRDHDGIADDVDLCPDVAGPAEQSGCPQYEKVAVLADKLEVKQKIAFNWDSAILREDSYPALDDVVRALHDNQAFRVEVEGHASSDGDDDHNQSLSEARAGSVLDYLAAHGIARDRLASRGFSSSAPLVSNETLAGRQSNRRVEFSIHFIIVTHGSTP